MGVPQSSLISPVTFLIFIPPLLRKLEEKLEKELGQNIEVEVPSYVDDLTVTLINLDGTKDMKRMVARAKEVIERVAIEERIPLEPSKQEDIIFQLEKRRNVSKVKWLDLILDAM